MTLQNLPTASMLDLILLRAWVHGKLHHFCEPSSVKWWFLKRVVHRRISKRKLYTSEYLRTVLRHVEQTLWERHCNVSTSVHGPSYPSSFTKRSQWLAKHYPAVMTAAKSTLFAYMTSNTDFLTIPTSAEGVAMNQQVPTSP